MAIRVAINGFGRIGRIVTRVAKMRHEFDIVAVNDLGEGEQLAALFKYDSTHGIFPGDVSYENGKLSVDGDTFEFIKETKPGNLPWKAMGVDYVVESSGVFRKRADLEQHLTAGARRVVLTVPAKDAIDATIVLGVNDHELKPEHKLLSNASCTTNCAAPMAKVLHDRFRIKRGALNTVH
ncbi:MAG: type I glyceraldehyde-3-phosphate dehydrogenase, partial [Planctomycetes bacterium]|nr:type I glyceraldehyde-3-phosphate dehydrogenase [Planctomycetota bacterium]